MARGGELPRKELLEGTRHPEELAELITAAERALRSWEPQWSGFLDAAAWEEAQERIGGLSEVRLSGEGGYPGAERRRLRLERADSPPGPDAAGAELLGLEIAGNFLFDTATAEEFRSGLETAGAPAGEVGDLWLRGDRGAQAIVCAGLARRLDSAAGRVRSVEVRFAARPIADLQLPVPRQPRQITTVEASLRLDAVASAGFGLSRSRMAGLIRAGAVRVDWVPTTSASREVAAGSRIQLEGRGELRIENVQTTQRGRWRITLLRS